MFNVQCSMFSPSRMNDLKFAFRQLLKNPGFTAVAVLTLALGIGANTAIFSLVNGLLFRSLPVAEPERLIRLGATADGEGFRNFSFQEYVHYRDHGDVFDALAAHQMMEWSFRAGEQAERIFGELVSANYFSTFRLTPKVGRFFGSAEDERGAAQPVLVLSHDLWRSRFNGDPAAVGSTVRLNGQAFTVVGVAPAGFQGAFGGTKMNLWVPLNAWDLVRHGPGPISDANERSLMLCGRLKPGVSGIVALALAAVGIYGVMFFIVSQRVPEIGLRMALGAQKAQVLRLVVVHGMRLATLGIVIGLAGAFALTRLLRGLLYGVNSTDPLTFTAIPLLLGGVALLACWLPASRAARIDPMEALRHE